MRVSPGVPPATTIYIGEQSAAHANLAMDAPDRKLDAFAIERFTPGQHVLIDAIDERAIEIESEGSLRELSSSWLPSVGASIVATTGCCT